MYRIDEGWEAYYLETEPERRREIWKDLAKEADDTVTMLRGRLWERRRLDPKNPKGLADRMLWQCVNLAELYSVRLMRRRTAQKEVLEALHSFGQEEAVACGEAGENAYYYEIRNAARRYLKTCQNPEYRRALFGLLSSGEKDRKNQMARDVWQMTEGVAGRFGLEHEMRFWTAAIQDEFITVMPSGRTLLAKFREGHSS